jgi:hypothetical protein
MIGLRLLEEAAAASEHLSPAARARIAAEQAQAYAALKMPDQTKWALGRAAEAVSEMTDEDCIGLYSDWSPSRLLVYKGTCHNLLGRSHKAIGELETAVNDLASDRANTNVLLAAKVDLAGAYAESGQLEKSCDMLADTYGKLKAVGNLRGVRRAKRARARLSRWDSEPTVLELDEKMNAA